MLKRDYDTQVCSIARSLEVVGERWSLLILRDVALGFDRFDDLIGHLGIPRSVLTSRLARLVEEGVLEREAYQERPARYRYLVTAKGRDLWPAMAQLKRWGDTWYPEEAGIPVEFEHTGCGGHPDDHLMCDRCGAPLDQTMITALPGPGAGDAPLHPAARG